MSEFREGLNFQHEPGGKVALCTLGDVTVLVQKFIMDVLKDYEAFGREEATREASMDAIRAKATALGRAFMGNDPAYYVTEWNSPNRLGAHIRAAVKFENGNQDPGEAFFLWLSTQVIQAANDLHTGTWKGQVGAQLQTVTQSAVKFLLTGEG
jgi:hypothetical protein